MWQFLLSACVLSSLLSVNYGRMVQEQKRIEFNKALRKPLLKQVGLQLKSIKTDVPKVYKINECKTKISSKYQECAKCLSSKFTERKPSKSLSVNNALMSLCSSTDVGYEICQLIIDQEQPFLEFMTRATKKVQSTLVSVLDPTKDSELLLEVFQGFLNEPWVSSSAADVRKSVSDAKVALQTPQEYRRIKRWTKYLKSVFEQMPSEVRKASQDYKSYMKKYKKYAKEMPVPRKRRSSAKKAPVVVRTKRWINMVKGIMQSFNVTNASNTIMSTLGKISNHIPITDSDTLKCGRGKCRALIDACSVSTSCPDPTKPMINDVCEFYVQLGAKPIIARLERAKDIFDAVRTRENFITAMNYQFRQMSVNVNVAAPNNIDLPIMNTLNMKAAANNAAKPLMDGLMKMNQSPPPSNFF
ncbi:uncharacterized protein LOC132545307 [Ylistrum balloti]|uniref:uncharacterized protein LOC132545307 n=1 Tax=Ylistrum balloti TaxID=509963 RepID=UPI002905A6FD|nr:uncharacterized protein LOC132545307 [Ylistrum balloti]